MIVAPAVPGARAVGASIAGTASVGIRHCGQAGLAGPIEMINGQAHRHSVPGRCRNRFGSFMPSPKDVFGTKGHVLVRA